MQAKETKFSYVYQSLKTRIVSGQLQQGRSLPSGRRLCQEYQVGIRTVTEVLKALQEEGLIEIQPRRAPRVCGPGAGQEPSAAALAVLAHRDGLMQMYRTMALLLPAMLTVSAKDCIIEELPHYTQAVRVDRRGVTLCGWRPVSALCQDVLCHGGNPLFCDVYATFDTHSYLNFFIREQKAFTGLSLQEMFHSASALIGILGGRDPLQKQRQLAAMYQKIEQAVAQSMERLEAVFPHGAREAEPVFRWNAARGRDHYYTRIVRDLVNKIGTGVYPSGTFLPPEAQLARAYGVSLSTVRSALAQLNRLGFGQTFNVKGTMALVPDDSVVFRSLQNQTSKQDTLLYLYALQFLILAVPPGALLAAPHITEEEMLALSRHFEAPGVIPLGELMQCVLGRLELEPLRVILEELTKLTQWGYYFAFYRNQSDSTNLLNQKSLAAFRCLQEGDAQGFAEGMAESYRHVLNVVRRFVVDKYDLQEARNIRTPDPFPR